MWSRFLREAQSNPFEKNDYTFLSANYTLKVYKDRKLDEQPSQRHKADVESSYISGSRKSLERSGFRSTRIYYWSTTRTARTILKVRISSP